MNNLAPIKNCPGWGTNYAKLDAGVVALSKIIEIKINPSSKCRW